MIIKRNKYFNSEEMFVNFCMCLIHQRISFTVILQTGEPHLFEYTKEQVSITYSIYNFSNDLRLKELYRNWESISLIKDVHNNYATATKVPVTGVANITVLINNSIMNAIEARGNEIKTHIQSDSKFELFDEIGITSISNHIINSTFFYDLIRQKYSIYLDSKLKDSDNLLIQVTNTTNKYLKQIYSCLAVYLILYKYYYHTDTTLEEYKEFVTKDRDLKNSCTSLWISSTMILHDSNIVSRVVNAVFKEMIEQDVRYRNNIATTKNSIDVIKTKIIQDIGSAQLKLDYLINHPNHFKAFNSIINQEFKDNFNVLFNRNI